MIYIIDDQIAYNSDDCTLSHIPTQETLSLSISSGRLFEQLLNSQGDILSRDVLLTEVWDKYGLRGSNSNLNQYLSVLRRALAAYGCENLIVTIPKIGIRLNTEISIKRHSSSPQEPAEVPDDERPAEVIVEENKNSRLPAPDVSNKVTKRTALTAGPAAILFIMLAVTGAIFWYFNTQYTADETSPLSTIKLAGGCEAVILQGMDIFEKKSLSKQILEMLKENNLSCVSGRRLYFDKNPSIDTDNYGRTILSACNLDSQNHIISCDNFYYLDWRMY